jgi:MATE family multidrug resistance protein
VALLCLLTLLAAPQLIVSAYTEDAAIRGLAIALIRLAAFFILLDAVHVTASFTLRAFKETRFPFIVTCIAFWMFMLPLGYWLGLVQAGNAAQGTAGFWRAMIAGIALSGLLISWRVLRLLSRPLPGAAAGQS